MVYSPPVLINADHIRADVRMVTLSMDMHAIMQVRCKALFHFNLIRFGQGF